MSTTVVAVLVDVDKYTSSERRHVLEEAVFDSWLSEVVVGKSSGNALSLLSMQASSMSSGGTSTSLIAREGCFCGESRSENKEWH